MQVDERTRTAIDRLTSNERECLRRRLLPQTAKEMAADLGVSPHAVEKRLKMARAKLGVSSSLAAARLLAAVERGEPLVPRSPALPPTSSPAQQEPVAHRSIGVVTMPMLLALLAAALPQSSAPLSPVQPAASDGGLFEDGRPISARKVDANEAATFIGEGFDAKDMDGSGYLDPREVSTMEPRVTGQRDSALPPVPPRGAPDPAAERKWMAKLDADRDGRVSRAEYVGYLLPWTLWQGVPVDWHPKR